MIWRVRDWKMEGKTKKPFKQSSEETMFLRLSWSPDGQQIAATNAFVNKNFTCALLDRTSTSDDGEWKSTSQFVGSTEPVSVASFHPKLLHRKGKNGTVRTQAVCAVGGGDKTLAVWTNTATVPMFVVRDLFDKHITDVTWGGQGYTLAACSTDGTVVIITMDAMEIGKIFTPSETQASSVGVVQCCWLS